MVSKEDMTAFLSTEFPADQVRSTPLATVCDRPSCDRLRRAPPRRYGIGTGADGGGRCRAVCRDSR